MNPKTENVFKEWLKLTEDEKREFVKQMLSYNSMSAQEQKAVNKLYGKDKLN